MKYERKNSKISFILIFNLILLSSLHLCDSLSINRIHKESSWYQFYLLLYYSNLMSQDEDRAPELPKFA